MPTPNGRAKRRKKTSNAYSQIDNDQDEKDLFGEREIVDKPVRMFDGQDGTTDVSFRVVSWENNTPAVEFPYGIKFTRDTRTVPKLSTLALQAIVPNVANIDVKTLSHVPFKPYGEQIWQSTLISGQDSFKVFRIFAEAYHAEPDFRTHISMDDLRQLGFEPTPDVVHLIEDRKSYFAKALPDPDIRLQWIPFLSLNRIVSELNRTTFSTSFLVHLNIVILTSHSREACIGLLKIQGLKSVSIAVSKQKDGHTHSFDTNVLHAWAVAMKSDNAWPSLLCFSFADRSNIITKSGLASLLRVSNRIRYFETDYRHVPFEIVQSWAKTKLHSGLAESLYHFTLQIEQQLINQQRTTDRNRVNVEVMNIELVKHAFAFFLPNESRRTVQSLNNNYHNHHHQFHHSSPPSINASKPPSNVTKSSIISGIQRDIKLKKPRKNKFNLDGAFADLM
ncbi:hypothetical protein V1514DRAFT_367617 [Lipomyces japonicus]|uniref:uncharacterized protein n=1 Tax=Lipomyces japonicus TaxID=56871 RepID=UPI0034CD0483